MSSAGVHGKRRNTATRTASDVAVVDRSDNETLAAEPGQGKTQRIAKACDRCRKSKSKCEQAATEGKPCKSCAAMGSVCTYTAPSFRRGPPKGYIQALEHRLHQVESVLAAIMSSSDPRAQSIVEELEHDDLASYILDSVDAGPFGRSGREKRGVDTSKDNFFASIVAEQPKATSHRSRRQSRATREGVIETVIAADPQTHTTRPTLAWQDRLSARLEHGPSESRSASPQLALSPPPPPPPPPQARQRSADIDISSNEPPRMKRRLVGPATPGTEPSAHRKESEVADDLGDCANAFGNLSIDENREVRYHGNSAGLHLLALTDRDDGRNAKGIWRFPMAKLWTGSSTSDNAKKSYVQMIEDSINLPPVEEQDHLVEVFFTYTNPSIPVLDRESFMLQYNTQKYHGCRDALDEERHGDGELRPERPQRLSMLLRLAVFAYSATLLAPNTETAAPGDIDGPAGEYARCARLVLDAVYRESRSSTVQALVILGIREFGMGSLEEGWLHIGMATRMALDLGLNRDPDKWMHNGRGLFNEKEKAIRKRIWWACCLADKFSALFLGRTIGIHEGDFSTPLMDIPADDLEQLWRPCAPDPLCHSFTPVPAMYISYFRHISSLYVIAGEVLAKIYRVSRANMAPARTLREQLYTRLLQWALELPDQLKYSYWAAVLLMHRPFIPKGEDLQRAGAPSLDEDPVPWESYDICQSAASQVASFATLYHEKYNMQWAPPFLSNCVQAAGILHIMTLRYKPADTQASVGLQKCIDVLEGMQSTWATALRVRHLLQGAKVDIDRTYTSSSTGRPGQKRARITFQPEQPGDRADTYGSSPSQSSHLGSAEGYEQHPRHRHQLRQQLQHQPLQAPPDKIFVGYMPGYDSWWPVLDQHVQLNLSVPEVPATTAGVSSDSSASAAVGGIGATLPSQDFTFTSQHFSQQFLQAMGDPVVHFPSAFIHHDQY